MLTARALRFLDWGPLDLSVAGGECVGLCGASGCGKSLLLRALVDLDPHTGEVALGGRRSADLPAEVWRRRVGMLPAESRWWRDRVGEHFPVRWEGAGAMLEALGLPAGEVLGWEVRRLSAGERQRLALARLLARGPEVLLLDEPTANLDPESGRLVEAVVERYRERQRAAVVWVSHDPAQLRRVAARVLRMADKQLREEG